MKAQRSRLAAASNRLGDQIRRGGTRVRNIILIHTVNSPQFSSSFSGRLRTTARSRSFRAVTVGIAAALVGVIVSTTSLAANLPPETRKSAAITDSQAAQIDAALKAATDLISSTTPADQAKGRDAIVIEVGPVGPVGSDPSPSPAFFLAYAQHLNKAATPLLAGADLRARINLAIAIARVAEKVDVGAGQLRDVTMLLLNDQSEAVALWGMKAARPVLRVLLQPGQSGDKKMLDAIVAVGTKFSSTTAAGYWALTVDQTPPLKESQFRPVIDTAHKLIEARLAQWADRVPSDPLAENTAFAMLSDKVWLKAQNPDQRKKSLQMFAKLAAAAGKQVLGTVTAEQKESIVILEQKIASSVAAISVNENGNVQNQLKPIITSLNNPRTMQPQAAADASQQIVTVMMREYPEIGKIDTAGLGTAPATNVSSTK